MLIKTLVGELVGKFESDNVCNKIGFCSEEDVKEERDLTASSLDSTINCTACEFSVKSLQNMAARMETRKLGLKPICDFLPTVPGIVCKAIDTFIGNDKKRRDFPTTRPREICRDVQMCAPQTVRSVPSEDPLVNILMLSKF